MNFDDAANDYLPLAKDSHIELMVSRADIVFIQLSLEPQLPQNLDGAVMAAPHLAQ